MPIGFSARRQSNPQGVKVIFTILGVIFLLVGLFVGWQFFQLDVYGLKAQGKIVNLTTKAVTNSNGVTNYQVYPVVQFTDSKNQSQQFEGSGGSADNFYSGEIVEVKYLTDSPQNAEIYNGPANYILPIGISLMGLLFLVGGILAGAFKNGTVNNTETTLK